MNCKCITEISQDPNGKWLVTVTVHPLPTFETFEAADRWIQALADILFVDTSDAEELSPNAELVLH